MTRRARRMKQEPLFPNDAAPVRKRATEAERSARTAARRARAAAVRAETEDECSARTVRAELAAAELGKRS